MFKNTLLRINKQYFSTQVNFHFLFASTTFIYAQTHIDRCDRDGDVWEDGDRRGEQERDNNEKTCWLMPVGEFMSLFGAIRIM